PESEAPSTDAVRAGAARLLEAAGEHAAAEVLDRATLESAPVPSASGDLSRYVARLEPADLVSVEKRPELVERLCWAIRRAGTRAASGVASVELAPSLEARNG